MQLVCITGYFVNFSFNYLFVALLPVVGVRHVFAKAQLNGEVLESVMLWQI